ncbi:MAG: recombination protein RecR [Candidatus Cloacimonetes bacterium]|nr:recombination protein RecR [Candidatus Cloacimonadota bacterium]
MIQSPSLLQLIQSFNQFPGIGRKTAQRLAWHLIAQGKDYANELAQTIRATAESFVTCSLCHMLSESDPCPICTDTNRDHHTLCVVEFPPDVYLFESINEFKGRYFVLGHLLSPLDGFGPEDIRIRELQERITALKPDELILALKPSPEGEATIHFISKYLKDSGILITRLSTGIPFGGDLEYTGSLTLANAFKRRYGV